MLRWHTAFVASLVLIAARTEVAVASRELVSSRHLGADNRDVPLVKHSKIAGNGYAEGSPLHPEQEALKAASVAKGSAKPSLIVIFAAIIIGALVLGSAAFLNKRSLQVRASPKSAPMPPPSAMDPNWQRQSMPLPGQYPGGAYGSMAPPGSQPMYGGRPPAHAYSSMPPPGSMQQQGSFAPPPGSGGFPPPSAPVQQYQSMPPPGSMPYGSMPPQSGATSPPPPGGWNSQPARVAN